MTRTARVLLLLLLPLVPAAAAARTGDFGPELSSVWVNAYEEEMNQTLDDAETAAQAGDWRKATSLYQAAADRATNQVRRVGARTYLGIREYVKSRIARWPEAGIAAYRGVVDPRVGEIYDAAIREGAPRGLTEIARRYPLSSLGARAMLDLGTFALARGDEDGALRQLLEILRIYPEGPIPGVERADVLARAAIAAAKRSDGQLVLEMKERAARLPADTRVEVGGEERPLLDLIRGVTEVPPGFDAPPGWASVGGSPSRSGGRSGPDAPLVPYWSFPIPRSDANLPEAKESEISPLFPVLPLITENEVIVAGQLVVDGLRLPEPGHLPPAGKPKSVWQTPPRDLTGSISMNSREGQSPVFLTRSGDLVTCAFPDPGAVNPDEVSSGNGVIRNSFLVLSLSRQGALLDQRGGETFPDEYREYTFCGAPVILGNRVWVTGTRPGNRVETLCFCFDLGPEPGRLHLRWKSSVCIGRGEATPDWRRGYRDEEMDASSVAVRNGIVYLCSNTGAVAALDGATGEILWVQKYERTEKTTGVYPNETKKLETWFPNPPVLDHRYLYVTPLDSDRLFVYFQLPDLKTGYVAHGQFSRDDIDLGFDPRYLLGVRDGVVYLAGDTRKRGERPLFAVKTEPAFLATKDRPGDRNRILWRAEIQEDSPCGRGAVAGDAIYFPTKKGIYRVAIADGKVTRLVNPADDAVVAMANGEPVVGNLAVSGPWLVSATSSLVTLFGPPPQKEKRETGD